MSKNITLSARMIAHNGDILRLDIPARRVGRLAVHRPVFLDYADNLLIRKDGWEVSDIASGSKVTGALPLSLLGATRARLIAWAENWQGFAVVGELLDATEAAIRDKGPYALPESTSDYRRIAGAALQAGHMS